MPRETGWSMRVMWPPCLLPIRLPKWETRMDERGQSCYVIAKPKQKDVNDASQNSLTSGTGCVMLRSLLPSLYPWSRTSINIQLLVHYVTKSCKQGTAFNQRPRFPIKKKLKEIILPSVTRTAVYHYFPLTIFDPTKPPHVTLSPFVAYTFLTVSTL